ncbi:MAG TPA: hypothetical protein VMD02_00205, partial [Candidatus Omnitrophota bacterium]|nr:hypothetical protein [Candidatus Omnitrophota bacterium]
LAKSKIGQELDAVGDKLDTATWDLKAMESLVKAWDAIFSADMDETAKGLIFNGVASKVDSMFAGAQPSVYKGEDQFIGGYHSYNVGVLNGLVTEWKNAEQKKDEEAKKKGVQVYDGPSVWPSY